MRFRTGLLLSLLVFAWVGVGCRKALAPSIDRNRAPETWITAAPQDTITVRDGTGTPTGPSVPTTIPVKFHVYWAGADPDGDIAGFYYAVVETLPYAPIPGTPIPSLPGPKPHDYRFTTRSDSTFIFSVSDRASDRQHAFFIYSVDNEGKPDPTPARVIFNALDRYPPMLEMMLARGTGPVWERLSDGSVVQSVRTFDITDTNRINTPVSSFVPATARLDFAWRSAPVIDGNPAVHYRYRLDETEYLEVDSSVTAVSYNTGVNDAVPPGPKIFRLRAVDQAGWRRQVERRFQFNLPPTTWFSGPDPDAFPYQRSGNDVFYDVPIVANRWSTLPEFTASLLSRDSVYVLPAQRPERKTFFEIYKNRIYVRSEWDTVHMNSYVVIHNGGLDADAPYDVKVNPAYSAVEALIAYYGELPPVLRDAPSNGSPIGFEGNRVTSAYPSNQPLSSAPTVTYPNFDPVSSLRREFIGQYWIANQAGLAHVFSRAMDSYGRNLGGRDEEVNQFDVPSLVQRVGPDGTGGSEDDRRIRRKILVFYVNKAPRFVTENGSFRPVYDPGSPPVYPSRNISTDLITDDVDPYNALQDIRNPGGPTTTSVTRFVVTVRGKDVNGRDTSYVHPAQLVKNFNIIIPSYLVSGPMTLDIQVCDCQECEILPGTGRCTTQSFPIVVSAAPSEGAETSSMVKPWVPKGPGSLQIESRSAVR
jgi:hypothetical protein